MKSPKMMAMKFKCNLLIMAHWRSQKNESIKLKKYYFFQK